MELASLYHRMDGTFGYQNLDGSLTIRLRSKRKTLKKVILIYGDRYNWRIFNKASKQWEWAPQGKITVPRKQTLKIYDYHEIILGGHHSENRYKYIFIIEDYKNNKYVYGERILKRLTRKLTNLEMYEYGFCWGYSTREKYVSAPEWWKKTNWYQIFPDRFHNGKGAWNQNLDLNQKTNGTLQGIIKKLNYIQTLGFNGVYLNPIFESSSPHMYDTTNYEQIASSLGSEEDLKTLISEIKRRKMRIMLDGVFNHCGPLFAPWQDVVINKGKSQYKDWFIINDFTNLKNPELYNAEFNDPQTKPYSTFANTPFMPRFNWSNPNLLMYFEKIVRKWTKMGIDAWRLDVADEPSFAFWRRFRQWAKWENNKVAILGEVWYDGKLFLNGDQFDSTMNYRFRSDAIDFIVNKKIDFSEFKNNYFENKLNYSKHISDSQLNLITTHDTMRIAHIANGNVSKIKALFTWLFINPGTTSFYYGDEYITEFDGATPEAGRILFDWNFSKQSVLYQHVKKMLQFRTKNFKSIATGIKNMEQKGTQIVIEYYDQKAVLFNLKTGMVS